MNAKLLLGGLAALAAIILLALLPRILDGYGLSLAIGILNYTVLATAWALFSGPTRYVSLATVAFFGIGAYTVAVLGEVLAWPLVLLIAVAGGAFLSRSRDAAPGSARSPSTNIVSLPAIRASAAIFSAPALFLRKCSARTVPDPASARAVAAPMPDEAPVTRQTRKEDEAFKAAPQFNQGSELRSRLSPSSPPWTDF